MNSAEQQAILEGIRSRGRTPLRSPSRGTSRSGSITPSMLEEVERPDDVTFRDPSERLNPDYKVSDVADDLSDEERLEDSDYDFTVEEEGRVLPNYQAYESSSKSTNVVCSGNPDDEAEMSAFNEKIQLKKAEKAKRIDSIVAASKAIANAQSIGREIPADVLEEVEKDAKEVGANINIDPDNYYNERGAPSQRLEDYSAYKMKVISPSSDDFVPPYTSERENKIDTELAQILNEKTKLSEIDSDNVNQRAVRTITRGNFFENIIQSNNKHPKSFLLCMDFSDESKYSLEWTIGTVLVDNSVLYLFNVIEDDNYSSMNLNGIQPTTSLSKTTTSNTASSSGPHERERTRVNNVQDMTTLVMNLLKLTKLQVHVVVISCHHPIPKQFLVSVIKQMSPTLVVVGSKGQSAIRGVILGSLSNFLVRRSPSPVMVVKSRLKKLTKKSKFTNIIHGLADAKID